MTAEECWAVLELMGVVKNADYGTGIYTTSKTFGSFVDIKGVNIHDDHGRDFLSFEDARASCKARFIKVFMQRPATKTHILTFLQGENHE